MIKMDKLANLKEIMVNDDKFEEAAEKLTTVAFFILLGIGIPFMIHIILQLL
ncbi:MULTISPECIES: hypothetical protein [unclassified Bacillus (in: firmicutes)]|uniref:hypothetical protein n=1 Tax=unclassified Bacillus (in: firmicutes) TaxID=185979 RepID=UPI0015CF7AC2|nr:MULTISPECIES: hypothetical protein [unclassified Bacillus (in: firmicutes)]